MLPHLEAPRLPGKRPGIPWLTGDWLAALVPPIAEIHAWNRLKVITRQPAGDYQPGQWG